jgi:hypothetical protein
MQYKEHAKNANACKKLKSKLKKKSYAIAL